MAMSSTESGDFMGEKIPEMDTMEGPKEKKKKKGTKIDIEDMYSFDLTMMKKPKPAKKQEEDPSQPTLKHLEKAQKRLAKIAQQEQSPKTDSQDPEEIPAPMLKEGELICSSEPKIEEEKVDEVSALLRRFPSPSRSRQSSPKKRDESPKKQASTSLNAAASEFVPPEVSLPKKISSLQANAAEFHPPGFESKVAEPAYKSMKASAEEFVPPGFAALKVATSTCEEQKESPFPPPSKEVSSQPVWSHAVFTPCASLESTKHRQQQQQAEKAEVPVPAQSTYEDSVDSKLGTTETTQASGTESWTIPQVDVGSILGKVKESLIGKLGGIAPNSESTKDPCLGKVQAKEAENEAEKQQEAAMKAMNDARQVKLKEKQAEMDETLMDCFLQAVKTHVKDRDLPMMGTTLYGKHMRSSRLVGTDCDVKDSSFVWLRPFLESLEDDGLLELKPEVKDPTVIWINRSHPLICKWQPWAYNETVGYKKGMVKGKVKIVEKEERPKNDVQKSQEIPEPMIKKEEPICKSEPKMQTEKVKEDTALLRFPSPSRSRSASPKKRDESPKKQEAKTSISLNAAASEFVPPSPLPEKVSSLQADATEFYPKHSGVVVYPPTFESKDAEPAYRSLRSSAEEFVPPGFTALKAATGEEQKESSFAPPAKEPAEKAEVPVAAQNICEDVAESKTGTTETTQAAGKVKWTIPQMDVGSILGKVKESLIGKLGGMVSNSESTKDPCLGENQESVNEPKEIAENEAEKQQETANKAMNDLTQVKIKKYQAKMDVTLMNCFLQAVTTQIKNHDLPMMGTTLYGKHMRSSRLVGTDCDVKESSFVWLRPFLESLEDDRLLKLKPEVQDPTVIWINRSHPLILAWQPWDHHQIVGYKKGVARR